MIVARHCFSGDRTVRHCRTSGDIVELAISDRCEVCHERWAIRVLVTPDYTQDAVMREYVLEQAHRHATRGFARARCIPNLYLRRFVRWFQWNILRPVREFNHELTYVGDEEEVA